MYVLKNELNILIIWNDQQQPTINIKKKKVPKRSSCNAPLLHKSYNIIVFSLSRSVLDDRKEKGSKLKWKKETPKNEWNTKVKIAIDHLNDLWELTLREWIYWPVRYISGNPFYICLIFDRMTNGYADQTINLLLFLLL